MVEGKYVVMKVSKTRKSRIYGDEESCIDKEIRWCYDLRNENIAW